MFKVNSIYEHIEDYTKYIFLFLLSLIGAWSWQLLPNHFIQFIEHSRKTHVIILFLLIFFTLDIFEPGTPFSETLKKTTIIFFVYLIISKQPLPYFFVTIALLILNAIISHQVKRYQLFIKQEKESEAEEIDQNKIDTYQQKLAIFYRFSKVVIIITLLIVIIGFSKFLVRQYRDHIKEDHNLLTFALKFFLEGSVSQRKYTGNVVDL